MTAGDAWSDVWALIRDEPADAGDDTRHFAELRRLCRTAERALDAVGVGISVMSGEAWLASAATSVPTIGPIEVVSFELGEGPALDAFRFRAPVLVPDVDAAQGRWPAYAPAVRQLGVAAVFAFPLQMGAARLGALSVYRERRGALSQRSVNLALTFTQIALTGLLGEQLPSGAVVTDHGASAEPAPSGSWDDILDGHLQIYQAQGMVSSQLGVGLAEAMARIRAYAFVHERRLREVAEDIVSRTLLMEVDARWPSSPQ